MKAKTFLLGIVFFALGMVVSFGIGSTHKHNNFNRNQVEVRKSTVIEVGAPLSVKEMKQEGLFKPAFPTIEVGAPLTVSELKHEGFI